MFWKSARKSAGTRIAAARASIDEWVATKPPPPYYERVYSAPKNLGDAPGAMKLLLERAGPLFQSTGQREFAIAFPEDAQRLDASCFYERASELLFKPTEDLFPLADARSPPEPSCELFATVGYGMLQTLLWRDQVAAGPEPGPDPWLRAARYAERAKQLLGQSGKSQEDWLDTVIRIEAVLGHWMLKAARIDQSTSHFLYLIGWCVAAAKLGCDDIVRKRYDDWLTALYAIVDTGRGSPLEPWISTAGTLLKDLQIGWRKVAPFRVENVPRASNGSRLDLHLQAAFVDDEWRQVLSALGDKSAVIDIVVTDKFVHTRLISKAGVRSFRCELPQIDRPSPPGEKPRGVRAVTPTSCMFEPVVSGSLAFLQAQWADVWHSVSPASDALRWSWTFHRARIFPTPQGWRWKFGWHTSLPVFEGELRRVIYEKVFAKAVEAAVSTGMRHLVVSPDGSLSATPHHLLRAPDGKRLADKFSISYAPNLLGVSTVVDLKSFSPSQARAIVVEDPTKTVGLASWECLQVAKSIGPGAEIVAGAEASKSVVQRVSAGASILHFTGHAAFNWSSPQEAFLRLAGDEVLNLSDLGALCLKPGALVYLSACDTGRRAITGMRSTSRGIVSSFFEAGAATVCCTLWPVHSTAAALVSAWFYEAWLVHNRGRLESLEEATRRLREATRAECESVVGRRIYLPGERPFADEYYWGAFVLYGAW